MSNEAQSEASLSVFTADSINADTAGNLPDAIFGVANTSYTGMTVPPLRLYTDCATVSPGRVDFHCTGVGGNTNLSGYVTRTVNGASVAWHVDLSMSVTISSTSGGSETENAHVSGDVTVTGGNQISGSLSLDASIHVADNGQNFNVTMNAQVQYNKLVYDATNHCLTSGNIVVQLDANTGSQSLSQAVRYTVTGCHVFTVAVAK